MCLGGGPVDVHFSRFSRLFEQLGDTFWQARAVLMMAPCMKLLPVACSTSLFLSSLREHMVEVDRVWTEVNVQHKFQDSDNMHKFAKQAHELFGRVLRQRR